MTTRSKDVRYYFMVDRTEPRVTVHRVVFVRDDHGARWEVLRLEEDDDRWTWVANHYMSGVDRDAVFKSSCGPDESHQFVWMRRFAKWRHARTALVEKMREERDAARKVFEAVDKCYERALGLKEWTPQ